MGWSHLVQDRDKSQALMNTEINHHHYWHYSTKWALASFRILCHPTPSLASIIHLTLSFLMSILTSIHPALGLASFFPVWVIIRNSLWHFTVTHSVSSHVLLHNEHLSCIKFWEFIDYLREYLLSLQGTCSI